MKPFWIIAGAVLLDRMPNVRYKRWAYPIGGILVALHIVISQTEPARYMLKRNSPEDICEWNYYYLSLLPLPWCANPPHS